MSTSINAAQEIIGFRRSLSTPGFHMMDADSSARDRGSRPSDPERIVSRSDRQLHCVVVKGDLVPSQRSAAGGEFLQRLHGEP
jgi:hypothetical protein